MAVVRHNILQNSDARDKYIEGVKLLKQDFPGTTLADLGISPDPILISTYDLFVLWHYAAMSTATPSGHPMRNAAHSGPIFLPWHRFMLIILELQLQRVLNDSDFGLPYWDWGVDGDLATSMQPTAKIWGDNCMGGTGDPVQSGPFAFDPANAASFRVRIDMHPSGALRVTDRGLRREFQQGVRVLPTTSEVRTALNDRNYDEAPWTHESSGFRNRVEGWIPRGSPRLHNRVHVWMGGDMGPATSPNDPSFYLNHCNVDRIWEAWLIENNRQYVPAQAESADLTGHRLEDPMFALISPPLTPLQTLDVSDLYTYDNLVFA